MVIYGVLAAYECVEHAEREGEGKILYLLSYCRTHDVFIILDRRYCNLEVN